VAPPENLEPATAEAQPELRDALDRRAAGPVNDALAGLVDQGLRVAPEHWTDLAGLAAGNPRVDRALLAAALGVRGVWFVGQNPQWARLASTLRHRRDGATG
jgi:hypothetical protein